MFRDVGLKEIKMRYVLTFLLGMYILPVAKSLYNIELERTWMIALNMAHKKEPPFIRAGMIGARLQYARDHHRFPWLRHSSPPFLQIRWHHFCQQKSDGEKFICTHYIGYILENSEWAEGAMPRSPDLQYAPFGFWEHKE